MVLGLLGCSYSKRYYKEYYHYFDTITNLITYDQEVNNQSDFIEEQLQYYHRLFDVYNEYPGLNNLATINNNAGINAVEVNQDLLDFLNYAVECFHLSEGKVNILMGSVLRVWKNYRDDDENKLPSNQELQLANSHTDIENLVIEGNSVYLKDSNSLIDVGALAKGYSIERIVEKLDSSSYIISSGGNVRTVGSKGGSQKWEVGITSPFDQGKILLSIETSDSSIVTSGDYQRFYEVDGISYSHIIDPQTLNPSTYYRSVTVVYPTSDWADYYSTLLFLLPFDQAVELVDSVDELEVCFVFEDGSIEYSRGFVGIVN